jgi:protocatechuate 3,4-dioxygenase beta subunit
VAGHVYARDCSRAVPGATVVAWQADDDGLYDYNHAGLNQGSSERELGETETRLRGMFTTSVSGTYAFETIFPSEYPLNLLDPQNSAYRAPHIHFAVFYTDRSRAQHQLVTQMYFLPTDLVRAKVPRIEELNAEDGGAGSAEPSRFAEVVGSSRDVWFAQFDIVLDVAPDRV